jgi:ribosome biogenesis GTPase A
MSMEPHHALLGLREPTVETIQNLLVFLDRLPTEYYTQIEKLYEIPALVRPIEGNRFINPAKDLLVHVARKFRRMGKNGPNLESAAQIVVEDCLKGKIRWWIE